MTFVTRRTYFLVRGSHWEVDGPPQTNKPRDPEGHQAAIREAAEQRRRHSPPIQATCPKGSFYLRDERMFHRGVSNRSDVSAAVLSSAVAV